MLLDELSFLATIDVKRELYLLETVVLIVDFWKPDLGLSFTTDDGMLIDVLAR